MLKIAIFGATSTIAKEYVKNILKKTSYEMDLFSRNSAKLNDWCNRINYNIIRANIKSYEQFDSRNYYDVIINFIGRGDPKRLKEEIKHFLLTNDYFDNNILVYLSKNTQTK